MSNGKKMFYLNSIVLEILMKFSFLQLTEDILLQVTSILIKT